MNTRQLRHFLAVLDLGSLSAATEVVHLSLPALSRSLRSLEDELRVPLFDRQDRRLRPTPYALAYAERARRIISDEKEGARSLSMMRSGEAGALAFGMGSSIANMLLGPLVLQLLSEAPSVHLTTSVQSADALLGALLREELDFFIGDVRAAESNGTLSAEPVHTCSFGWFARQGHPLAKRSSLTISDLKRYPMTMFGYSDGSLLRRLATLYGLSMPIQEHFAVNTNDVATTLALLTSSDMIAPCTDVAVISALRSGALIPLDVSPALALDLTFGIIEQRGRSRLPITERALQIIRSHFSDVAEAIRDRGRIDRNGSIWQGSSRSVRAD